MKPIGLLTVISFVLSIMMSPDYCLGQNYKKKIKQIEKQAVQSKDQAKKIRIKIESTQKKRQELIKKEGTLTGKLKKINREITKIKKELKKLQDDIKKVKKQKEKAHADLKLQQVEASRWNSIASREAGYLYRYGLHKKGQEDIWLINAISSKGFGDYIRRQKYMKAIISQKTSVLQRARKQCEAIVRLEKNLDSKEEELKSLTKKQKSAKSKQEKKEKEQKKLRDEVRKKRKKAEVEISELKKSAKALQKMIDKLVTKKKEIVSARDKKQYKVETRGTLRWPIKGEGEVISFFGKQKHPDMDAPVFNKGIKIKVPYGNSVIAIEKGNVLYANEFMGYGKMLIVDHGKGFYSIYGQLLEFLVRENDEVQKTQSIGRSGSVLYFEIRMDGKPEDPLKWLK